MNINQKNKIIIISSPSGAGKTTLCKLLIKKMKNNDVDYEFRQDSSFWYFSGFEEPDAVMVLDGKSKKKYTMFVNPYDPDMAIWVGGRAGAKGIEEDFGADKGISINKLKEKLYEITEQHERIYYSFGDDPIIDPIIKDILIKRRQSSDRRNKNPLEIKDPSPLINEMRLIKSKEEILSLDPDYLVVASNTALHHEQLVFIDNNLQGRKILIEKPLFDVFHDCHAYIQRNRALPESKDQKPQDQR